MEKITYDVIDEDYPRIHSKEKYDLHGRVIYRIEFLDDQTKQETITEYNSYGEPIEETQKENDIEISKKVYLYNQKGDVCEWQFYINGELYEKEITNYLGEVTEWIRIIEGEEVKKVVSEINEPKKEKVSFYNYGELTTERVSLFDDNGQLIEEYNSNFETGYKTKSLFTYDGNGYLINERHYNGEDQLLDELTLSYDKNNNVIEQTHVTYNNSLPQSWSYEYDDRNNITKRIKRTPEGHPIEFQIYSYDEKDRIIEERGTTSDSSYDFTNVKEFHFRHEYLE